MATPVGIHCIMELYDCGREALNDEAYVRASVEEAARVSRSTLLQLTSHPFEPQGVTAVALLAESHLSVHTWPEYGYAAVDIFTCGEQVRPGDACRTLAERLGAARHVLKELRRGGSDLRESAAESEREEADLCPAPN